MKHFNWLAVVSLLLIGFVISGPARANPKWRNIKSPVRYVNWEFENGSPLSWQIARDGRLIINPIPDIERNTHNTDLGHWHFQLYAVKGSDVKVEINNCSVQHGLWKGTHISEKTHCFVSTDGRKWKSVPTEMISDDRLTFTVYMEENMMYVSRAEPYRVSDLGKLKAQIKDHPQVKITPIGHTFEGRELEIIRLGNKNAPYRVFIRIRPHAWEVSGSWAIQGLIRKLTSGNDDAKRYLERYCIYTMPMANKDSVWNGRQYYTSSGINLNTVWGKPADPKLAPESHCLEEWLKSMIEKGRKPHLAIDWHNDVREYIYQFRRKGRDNAFIENMNRMVELLRKYSWYTSTEQLGKNRWSPGVMTSGFLSRYKVDSFGFELNIDWCEGLNKEPYGKDWELFGEQLCEVLYQYFEQEPARDKEKPVD